MPSLPPGSYALRAWTSGYAPADLGSITIPSHPLSVSLTPGGALEIRLGAESLARSELTGRLLRPDGSAYALHGADGVLRLNQPLVRLPNVAPGRYSFVTDTGVTQAVDIVEGGTAQLTLP